MAVGELDGAFDAARSGDEWALSCLFRAIQPQLLRYLKSQAFDMAEDLASEVWLSAAPKLADFDGSVSDFRALLFTIARRRVVDHYRRRARHPSFESLQEDGCQPEPNDAVEIVLETIAARDAIRLLVDALPQAQAEVVLLRVVADLSVEEVAKVVDRSEGAVRVLQHRALRRLAQHFEHEGVTR